MRLRALIFVILIFAAASFARVGVLRTTDGETLEGRIRITPERVFVVNAARMLVHAVALSNVAQIAFPRPDPQESSEAAIIELTGQWNELDIGSIFTPGSTRFEPGAFTVRSAGMRMDGEADSFHYVYKPVQGDSEIVAEVTSIQYTHPNAKAGLMMRENLGEYSRNILIALTAMRGGQLQVRENDRSGTAIGSIPGFFAPYWLKLKRRGDEFSAYLSQNGRIWSLVQKTSLAMAERFYVGLAVTSNREGMLNWTTFRKVREGRKIINEDFTPEVELVSGSILTGRPVHADLDEVVFAGAPKVLRVPTASVARIAYQPLMGELSWKTRASRSGVWVSNGDFFDGEFRRLDQDRLSISSVLYGLRTFDVDEEVLAVVLRPRKLQRPQFALETVDGTFLLASELKLGDGEIKLREAAVGDVRIPAFEILDLRRR